MRRLDLAVQSLSAPTTLGPLSSCLLPDSGPRLAVSTGTRVADLGGTSVKGVSTWEGHSSAAFTLYRYPHLFDTFGDKVATGWTPD